MPEDRFGDLGPKRGGPDEDPLAGRADDRPAAEQLAELDEREPEPDARPPEPARPSGRYNWVIGVAAVIVIVVAGVVTLSDPGEGSHGPPTGAVMPDFAAPSATGDVEGDANVKQGADDEGSPNKTPACDVHGPGVVNICDIRRTRPVVLTLFVPGAKDCEREVDRLDRLASEMPQVAFVAVASGRSKGRVERVVRDRGWRIPVAVDQDLAVFNTYRVAFCATTVFARRGGVVRETKVKSQDLSDAQLRASVDAVAR